MKRKLLAILLFFLVPGGVLALGLGKLELNSNLNQPFDARIELLRPTAAELESLRVGLADIDAFRRAGVDRPFILSKLKFEVQVNEGGPDYIRITSQEVIPEPFLSFLVEATWSNGRLFREYTVLLDPPLYDPNVRRGQISGPPVSPPAGEGAGPEPALATAPVAGTVSAYTGGDYGPTESTDTLWSIATQTRPGKTVSIQQMMLALLKANPDVFINNNINGLKRGQVLKIPDQEAIAALPAAQALEEVKSQYAAWEEMRGTVAAAPPERPVSSPVVTAAPAVPATVPADATELRLLTPAEGEQEGAPGAAPSDSAKISKDLALTNEHLTALSSENLELKDRMSEAETIIEDLQRLITLKDDELAKLQQQLAGATTPVPAGTTEPAAIAEEGAKPGQIEEEHLAPAPGQEVTAEAETAAPAAEEEKSEPAVTEPAKPVTPQPPILKETAPAAASLVDQILGFIMGNLLLIGAGGGGVILVIVALVILRNRRSAGETAAVMAPTAFPDFATSDDETEAPVGSEDATDIKLPVAAAEEEVQASGASEATVFMEAPPAKAKVAPAAPVAEQPEEDPLAEVNVFLAYEHFDQAEEFVRDTIAGNPDNLDFHSKLLEVFYAAGDKAKYEEEARVLNEKVQGQGPHWDMALVMWQEMSPNRALFAAPIAGEETKAEKTVGGIVDLTAEEDAGLDFDLGTATAEKKPAKPIPPAGDEEILDITAGVEEGGTLEMTAAGSATDEDVLDLTAAMTSESDEGLLDVTAAVGLDTEQDDADTGTGGDDEDLLDITGSRQGVASGDTLVIAKDGGEDLLDVTAHANLEGEGFDEDLLDVTAATSAGADAGELLEVGEEQPAESGAEDNSLDFDIGGLELEVPGKDDSAQEAASLGDNVIDFDSAAAEKAGNEGVELDLSSDDGGLEIDLSLVDEDSTSADISLDSGDQGMDLELTLDEESAPAVTAVPEIDMDSTIEIPKSSLELMDEEEDDDDAHTVFVPRSSDAQEQSADDEIATKLDLAKAYVELGDKDSAKSILDEIMADGNDAQRKMAQNLMGQLS